MTTTSDNRRYYGLDALRGSMMLLGVVLHSAQFYIAAPTPQMAFLPIDPDGSRVFDLVFHFIHSFRMPLFFMLAGFFGALLVEKRGMWGTLKDRGARIALPLLAGTFTVVPIAGLFFLDFMIAVRFGVMDVLPDRSLLQQLGREMKAMGAPQGLPGPAHLWFLLYLCYFYLLMPGIRWIVERTNPGGSGGAAFLASALSLPALALVTSLALLPFHGGQVQEGFLFLKPHGPSIAYYGTFFAFGYFLHAHRKGLESIMRFAPACGWLALILFPLSLWLSYREYYGVGDISGYHLEAVLAHGFCTWTLIYAFTGWMLRRFDYESPWVLYVSQSAYWVYLLHLCLTTFTAWLLVPYALPAFVKFAIVFTVTTVVCFTTYHYLVQRTWVSRFLHGRTFDLDWPWRCRQSERVVQGT